MRGESTSVGRVRAIEDLLQQSFIQGVLVDEAIGINARRMMRRYEECKKPTDAIHLASALRLSVDEMHTYDGSDLLGLDGKILCANGRYLSICRTRPIPAPVVIPPPLLELLNEQKNENENG